jgi:diguanylate cyclase (GGDEF)-like protein
MLLKLSRLEYSLGELEPGYRRQYLKQDIKQTILFSSTWMVFNLLFIYSDSLIHGYGLIWQTALQLRLSLFITTMVGCFILLRIKRPAVFDWLGFTLLCSAYVHVFMLNHLQPISQYAGLDYLIVLGIYFLVPIRVLFRLIPSVIFSLSNIIMYFTYFIAQSTVLPASQLVIIISSFLLSNGLGIWASSQFYSHRRQQYEAQTRALELRKDLIQNALFDQLTGVANRRHFFQAAEEEFGRFIRYNRSFSLLMLDVDHFKEVNDKYGHPVGDKVLKELAETLLRNKRDTDLFGRLGGEEFALLLPETTLSGATEIAVRLRRTCYTIGVPGHMAIHITVSIGVTQVRNEDSCFDDVLARVDETLYRAKNNGRDRVEVA